MAKLSKINYHRNTRILSYYVNSLVWFLYQISECHWFYRILIAHEYSFNGNEIIFIFLLLHLPKYNSYMKICLLAKNTISSSNTFTKAYFLFSHRQLEATESHWVCYRTQNRGRKNRILIKDKSIWLCLIQNTLLWCHCCEMEFDWWFFFKFSNGKIYPNVLLRFK